GLDRGGETLPARAGTEPKSGAGSLVLWHLFSGSESNGRRHRRNKTRSAVGSTHAVDGHVLGALLLRQASLRRSRFRMPESISDGLELLFGPLGPRFSV